MKQIAIEGVCPICGSHDIEYGILEPEFPAGVYFDCECNKCHATFNEWYDVELYGQTGVVEGDEPYDGREDVIAEGKVELSLQDDTMDKIADKFADTELKLEIYKEPDGLISLYIGQDNSSSAIYRVNNTDEIGRAVIKYILQNT